jgi:hypothetical protein
MTDNLPVNWEDQMAADAKEVATIERTSLSQISLRAGVMMFQGMPVPGNKLQCVVVGSAFQNRYYKDKWDPNNPSNPACFSLSLDGRNMVPHESVEEPQSNTCDSCPQFQWKSDPGGGRGKACKSGRRLVVLPAQSVKDGGAKKAEMAMLTIPVTSAKNWSTYVNGAAVEYRRPPWGLLTEISVAPDAKTQFQVRFETIGIVNEQYLGDVHSRIGLAQDVLMTPYDTAEQVERAPVKDSKKY